MTITRADGKHVHYDLITEWAKTPNRKLQVMGPYSDDWKNISAPSWAPTLSYRFKPKVITITHRRALMKNHWDNRKHFTIYVIPEYQEDTEKSDKFVKWLGEDITETFEI